MAAIVETAPHSRTDDVLRSAGDFTGWLKKFLGDRVGKPITLARLREFRLFQQLKGRQDGLATGL
jgi:hypothetical protein